MNLSIPFFMAGADTVFSHYNSLISNDFRNSEKYLNNKYMNGRPNVLLSYGIELIKKSLPKNGEELHNKAKNKLLNVYNTYHNSNRPFMVDSGGFSIFMGKVPINYIDYLIKYYLQFITETCKDPKYDDMVYQFMDIVPVNGITMDYSIEKMTEFYNGLIENLSDIPNALNKIYIIMQTSSILAYNTFHNFIWNNKIYEKINSHKYAVGQLVPLNFNSSNYIVRPYMIALLDVLELELENLKNNIPVYFHILGTSAITEIILISWLNIICKEYNLPLNITCDSTAIINNAAKSGILHFINNDNIVDDGHRITSFETKYKYWNNIIPNRKYTNKYYIDRIYEEMHSELDFSEPDDSWYDGNRYSKTGGRAFCTYEAYAFAEIFKFIEKVSNKYKDYILNIEKRCMLKKLIFSILEEINPRSINSNGRDSINKNVVAPVIKSLDYFELAINNKLDKKYRSYHLVNTMMVDNIHLSTAIKKFTMDDFKFDNENDVKE